MKRLTFASQALLCAALLCAAPAFADSISLTGTLANSTSTVQQVFTLTGTSHVTVQSWGFGGSGAGNNAAGTHISAGGFDEMLALFTGTGNTAAIYNIGGDPNDPAGTSDVLSNYDPEFVGCGPAGKVNIGGTPTCGDIKMTLTLGAGTYTLVMADAGYVPNALVTPGSSTLGDGFVNFTGGVFQTCDTNSNCIVDSNKYAFDIVSDTHIQTPAVPEPGSLLLLGTGIAGAWRLRGKIR
jgi:hypothetical protein